MTAPATLVMLCGLPASGKTTAAERLHARLGGTLIRSCDVYQALGIDLPAWVRRTRGFTRAVRGYERARDLAYVEMARLVGNALVCGESPVVVDAVHGEPAKRRVLYDLAAARSAAVVLVRCRCDDPAEVARRFAARRDDTSRPENEAADLSVHRHISGLWRDPLQDPAVGVGGIALLCLDSVTGAVTLETGPASSHAVDLVRRGLEPSLPSLEIRHA